MKDRASSKMMQDGCDTVMIIDRTLVTRNWKIVNNSVFSLFWYHGNALIEDGKT